MRYEFTIKHEDTPEFYDVIRVEATSEEEAVSLANKKLRKELKEIHLSPSELKDLPGGDFIEKNYGIFQHDGSFFFGDGVTASATYFADVDVEVTS